MLKICLHKLHDLCYFMITHTYNFFVYQPSYYQIQIKVTVCQTESIMTLNCELSQSGFSVLSGRLIIKLSKICFLYTYVDQMIIQQRFDVLFQFQFYNIFTNVISIIFKCLHYFKALYEVPKICTH